MLMAVVTSACLIATCLLLSAQELLRSEAQQIPSRHTPYKLKSSLRTYCWIDSRFTSPTFLKPPNSLKMHIQPGVLNGVTIAYANETALVTIAAFIPAVLKKPDTIVRTVLAALFFSVLMQSFHMSVGPSELHLVGASTIYFLFGFIPTLLGFALGLLLQGTIFEQQDLIHLGVNSLSLILPLMSAHALIGRKFLAQRSDKTKINWSEVIRFDSIYYSGVVAMVGFWLLNGTEATPFVQWGIFAISYLPVVLLEPVLTVTLIKLIKEAPKATWIRKWTVVDALQVDA